MAKSNQNLKSLYHGYLSGRLCKSITITTIKHSTPSAPLH